MADDFEVRLGKVVSTDGQGSGGVTYTSVATLAAASPSTGQAIHLANTALNQAVAEGEYLAVHVRYTNASAGIITGRIQVIVELD